MYCVQIKSQDVFLHAYNNCFVNAVIKSIVLYQKVNFVTFLKALAQNTKTTFFKYRFLMKKHRLNTMKHRLLVEKDRGNACRKNKEKKTSRFFLANFFRGLSFYGAGCTYIHGAFSLCSPCWFPLLIPLADSLCSPLYPFHLLGTLQLWQESSTSVSGCL